MSGLDGAAAAFAEDLGGSTAIPSNALNPDANNGAVEQLGRDFDKPIRGGGDFVDDDEEGEEGHRTAPKPSSNPRQTPPRGDNGQFQPREEAKPRTEQRNLSLADALEDPLDDEHEEAATVSGEEAGDIKRVSINDIDGDQEIELTVDGQPHKVKASEALAGYIRQETFHRRLSQLDTVVKEQRSMRNEIVTAQGEIVTKYKALQSQLAALEPKEPDWEAAYKADPNSAAIAHKEWQNYKATKVRLDQETAAEQQRLQQAQQQAHQEFQQNEGRTFMQRHPEYQAGERGQKLWDRDRKGMFDAALESGFTKEEAEAVYDHRMLEILLDASRFRRLKARQLTPTNTQGQRQNGPGNSRPAPNPQRRTTPPRPRASLANAEDVFAAELQREMRS